MENSKSITISWLALWILKILTDAGYEAYIVGGAVRDLLTHQDHAEQIPNKKMDYDFTTNAKPEEIRALFPESFYENTFGTVSISAEHLLEQINVPKEGWNQFATPTQLVKEDTLIDLSEATKVHESLQDEIPAEDQPKKLGLPLFEMTTFRTDGTYTDNRRPDSVSWGETLEEDLERRDFTINAMALSVSTDLLSSLDVSQAQPSLQLTKEQYLVHDPHHGLTDLDAHLIKTVGNAETRFSEDALRMLRAVRFSVQLNCQIDDTTYQAILHHADALEAISYERISDEFMKILASNYPAEGVELLDQTDMLRYVLPELLDCKGVKQGGHHTTDVWTHSIDALRECPSPDPVVRLATLIHDIGKPSTQGFSGKTITFYNHEIVGSRIASRIANRLRLSKKDRERVFTLVRYHMFHYQPHDTDAAIRRFMRKVGLENLDDILDLREGDRLGSGARRTSWRLEEMKQRMVEQLHQPMEVKDLAVSGHDLMNKFDLKPGPILGDLLQQLFEKVVEDPELNTKRKLLKQARDILDQSET